MILFFPVFLVKIFCDSTKHMLLWYLVSALMKNHATFDENLLRGIFSNQIILINNFIEFFKSTIILIRLSWLLLRSSSTAISSLKPMSTSDNEKISSVSPSPSPDNNAAMNGTKSTNSPSQTSMHSPVDGEQQQRNEKLALLREMFSNNELLDGKGPIQAYILPRTDAHNVS